MQELAHRMDAAEDIDRLEEAEEAEEVSLLVMTSLMADSCGNGSLYHQVAEIQNGILRMPQKET